MVKKMTFLFNRWDTRCHWWVKGEWAKELMEDVYFFAFFPIFRQEATIESNNKVFDRFQ